FSLLPLLQFLCSGRAPQRLAQILVLLLLPAVAASCLKESGTTTVEGQLVDATTGQPVPYGQVTLKFSPVGSGGVGGFGVEEEHTADAGGNFSFKFDASGSNHYKVDGYKTNYYFGAHEDGETIKGGRRIKNLSIKLKPMAFVKYHFLDVDSLPFNGAGVNATLCNTGSRSFSAIGTDTSIVCRLDGNQMTHIVWYRDEGDPPPKMYPMDIYLPAHDTTSIQILF
ncbi:MAG: carboxypeptidase-like regulatory domain-containing protein, partial [Bacteroidota bacterium]|nr:carboxypeptidase-like regulatory domain-containing protein [Bacteroidota bacterium]